MATRRLNRRAVITGAFLTVTVTAVGMEVWFATDSDPDTLPWTTLLVDNVPGPIILAAVAVLTSWIGPHFIEAIAKRKARTMSAETVTVPATPEAGAPREPLFGVGWITAVAAAALSLAVAFGMELTEKQTGAVLTLVALVGPGIVVLVGRRKVYAPATVRTMVVDAANNLQPGQTRPETVDVPAP